MKITNFAKYLIPPQRYSKINHPVPYIYELGDITKKLLVLGSIHTNNPISSQFRKFKNLFIDFKPKAVFVEGGWDKSEEIQSEDLAIKKGEMAFMVFIARKYNVPVLGWEPGMKKEIAHLMKEYSREEIFIHFVLRTVRQYNQYGKPKNYLDNQVEEIKKMTNWKDFDYSMSNLKRIHKKIFNLEFNPDNWRLYNIPPYVRKDDPSLGPSVINYISRDEMVFRDTFAVKKILDGLKRYNRILAIMGSGHAVVQEPVYRHYFKKSLS